MQTTYIVVEYSEIEDSKTGKVAISEVANSKVFFDDTIADLDVKTRLNTYKLAYYNKAGVLPYTVELSNDNRAYLVAYQSGDIYVKHFIYVITHGITNDIDEKADTTNQNDEKPTTKKTIKKHKVDAETEKMILEEKV